MNRRSAIRKLVILGAGPFVARLLAQGSKDEQENYTFHGEVRLVLLDVSVKDGKGRFVSGLSKENFKVYEDGRLQRITVFDHNDLPVTVGLLVDESRSMTPKRNEVIAAAEAFIEESNRQDEIFILNFNDTVSRGLPPERLFSDNIQQLRAALYRGIPRGKTALIDAILTGSKQLELGKRDKKTLIVISDGGDNASRHSRRDAFDMVERSIATIYAIGLFESESADRDPALLRHLARVSGGEAYFPSDLADVKDLCRRIAKDIRSRYTIGYLPEARNGTNALRRIRIHVAAPDRSGLVARTRTSYRYDEGGTPKSI